jgi:tetratricopeptide (TPR) repeat protein
MFPWHDPAGGGGTDFRAGPDAGAMAAMYALCAGPLIPAVLRHRPCTFPASSHMALRLLAFALSFLRLHFTRDRVLRLSGELLSLLERWCEGSDELLPEELQLSKQLREDFGRFPPAEVGRAGAAAAAADSALRLMDCGAVARFEDAPPEDAAELAAAAAREAAPAARPAAKAGAPPPPPADEAGRLRTLGNSAYQRGAYTEAITAYSAALDVPVPAERLLTEGPRRAVLHVNRAAAYLARAAAGGGTPGAARRAHPLPLLLLLAHVCCPPKAAARCCARGRSAAPASSSVSFSMEP